MYYRFNEVPQRVFSYRWAISEPRETELLVFQTDFFSNRALGAVTSLVIIDTHETFTR